MLIHLSLSHTLLHHQMILLLFTVGVIVHPYFPTHHLLRPSLLYQRPATYSQGHSAVQTSRFMGQIYRSMRPTKWILTVRGPEGWTWDKTNSVLGCSLATNKSNNIQVYHPDAAFELPFQMSELLTLSLRASPNTLRGKLISATSVTAQSSWWGLERR